MATRPSFISARTARSNYTYILTVCCFGFHQAPHCTIHSFDPTLPAAAERKMYDLQAAGVLSYHRLGLSHKRGLLSAKKYRDGSSDIKCNSPDFFQLTTAQVR
jgi:hypothetical protein